MSVPDFIRYDNQGATRNQALAPDLLSALGFLPDLGVTMEVFSGGQPAKGSGGKRVGSTRHDHGNAADVFFYKDGRRLDWSRKEDLLVFQEIVSRGRANGLTGFGAGPGYMQPGSMHIGFGNPGVWGAGGSGANAPDWLRAAYNGGSAPTRVASASPSAMAYAGATPTGMTGAPAALLNLIAGTESPDYNVLNGGERFSDLSDHPRRKGRNGESTAAGRYQFVKDTWDRAAQAVGAKDFSPASQDKAAWWLAQADYKTRTGRDLEADLASGDPVVMSRIQRNLSATWKGLTTLSPEAFLTKLGSSSSSLPPHAPTIERANAMASAAPQNPYQYDGRRNLGGLGGLGGYRPPENDMGFDTGGLLRAIGASLIAGDASVIPQMLALSEGQRQKQYERKEERAYDQWLASQKVNKPIEVNGRLVDPVTYEVIADFSDPDTSVVNGRVVNTRTGQTIYEAPAELTNVPAGTTVFDPETRQPVFTAPTEPKGQYRPLTDPAERQRYGIPTDDQRPYQVGPDDKVSVVGGGGVTVNTGQSSKFRDKADERMVERFGTYADAGTSAVTATQTIPVMRELLAAAPQGPIVGRLAEMYPGFSTAGDALSATVNQIAPTLRVPGSGALSDRDMDILMGSFPRLRNDPAANQIIMTAFEKKAQLNVQRAEIATAALRGEIDPAEADRRIAELDRVPILDDATRRMFGGDSEGGQAPAGGLGGQTSSGLKWSVQ